jgi:hypothetical protein
MHPFDPDLSSHRTAPVGLLLHVNQPDRTPVTCIPGTFPMVMLAETTLRVGRPAGVKSPIHTFEDIAITGHGEQLIRIRLFVAPPEDFVQAADLLF